MGRLTPEEPLEYARRVRIARAFGLLWMAVVALHCSKEKSATPTDANPSPSAAPSGNAATGAPEAKDDSVRSVYPLDAGPPDPLVVRLCEALHDLPEKRRAACCDKSPSIVFTSECTRTLTGALRSNALTLDPGAVDRCAAAMDKVHEGCEWVGPLPPEPPPECEGILRGTLAAGARCRSSLECTLGLRCQGSGPTSPGVCRPPHKDGESCGASVDALASFTKQTHFDALHPECTGYCDHLRCAPLVAMGGACHFGAQCADAGCAAGKCAPHVLAKAGEACPTDECEDGARCLKGSCVAKKPSGSVCTTDFECMGACIKGDAGTRTCGRRCDVR
jgi:hypothetical protein